MNIETLACTLDMDDATLMKDFYISYCAEEIANEVAGNDADETTWWLAFENAHIDGDFIWCANYENIPIEDLEGRMRALGDGLLFEKMHENLRHWREGEDDCAQRLQRLLEKGEALVRSPKHLGQHQE